MMHSYSSTRRSFLKGSLATGLVALARVGPVAASVPPPLALHNIHTGEDLRVSLRTATGAYDREGLAALDHLLRCHATNQTIAMDVRVIEFLDRVTQAVAGDRVVQVISGYRSPEYNDWLIRRGHGVARNSLHMRGRAVDISVPGIPLATLRRVALGLRYGGVGYYPASGFIHLDSGPARSW
jgi:uncharacterized protein YcbK (DUF882 family)